MGIILSLMLGIAILITAQQVLVSIVSVIMLRSFKKEEEQFSLKYKDEMLPEYPGISIVTSIRGGVVPSLEDSLKSLVNQDYPGPMELVIAIEDDRDEGYAFARKVLANNPRNLEIRWLTNFPMSEGNPRSVKLFYAMKYTKYPWIYWHAADSYFDNSYFTKLLTRIKANPKIFTSMLTIQTGARNIWAYFENAPIVWEATLGLLLGRKMGSAFINGCGFLFSREIMNKSKNIDEVVNYLTEEIPFTEKFKEAGGHCELVPTRIWVKQDRETFGEFYWRRVRWAIMAKHHHPTFYVLGLLFSNLPAIIFGLLTGDIRYAFLIGIALIAKSLSNLAFHIVLNAPKRDWLGSLIVPFYDFLFIAFNIHAFFQKTVVWKDDAMIIRHDGVVVRQA